MRRTWHGANHPTNTGLKWKPHSRTGRLSVAGLALLAGAAIGGATVGAFTSAPVQGQVQALVERASSPTKPDLYGRSRTPQPGDYWPRCSFAQYAGSAPIYANEPGYRAKLDADHDGVACEPLPPTW